ncbi:hypothetical protein AAXB25_14395 [Paenibacillus lautus]|uniref:hypothetical protein n=1 Tax=Paenibacillus lautus TaxID=1401 RepID=UPI003D2A8EB1
MNFTLTADGFVAESDDFVSVDEVVRVCLNAGFNVEVKNEITTIYKMDNNEISTESRKATVITVKP